MSRTIDFTQGSIARRMILYAIPLILGEVFQNFYNSVDILVVGNFVGKTALAAVSVCGPIAEFIIGFFNGMSIGASVIISRGFGSADRERLRLSMRVTVTFSVILGVVLSVIGFFATPLLLKLTSVQAEIYTEAAAYLKLYLMGIMFTVIYNMAAGVLRAIGDTQSPFAILVATCCLNIALDLLFAAGMHMGVVGVALATVLAQGASVILVFVRLRRYDPAFDLSFGELCRSGKIIREMTGIGMPTGVQSSLIQVSNLFVWRYINGFSAAAVAGMGIASRLDKFIVLPSKALGLTLTTFISQNVGAGNQERNRQGIRVCTALSLGTIEAFCVILYFSAPVWVGLFSDDAEVIGVGVEMMRTVIPLYFLLVIREMFFGILRGFGDAKIPMLLSLAGMVGARQIFLAVSMRIAHVIENVYYGYPVAWGATALFVGLYYFRVRKKYFTGE